MSFKGRAAGVSIEYPSYDAVGSGGGSVWLKRFAYNVTTHNSLSLLTIIMQSWQYLQQFQASDSQVKQSHSARCGHLESSKWHQNPKSR